MEKITMSGRYDLIPISDIITRLVQEAGRWCEDYASDVVYHINDLTRMLREVGTDADLHLKVALWGFRRRGVDIRQLLPTETSWGAACDMNRHNDYRAVWELSFIPAKNGEHEVTITLERAF